MLAFLEVLDPVFGGSFLDLVLFMIIAMPSLCPVDSSRDRGLSPARTLTKYAAWSGSAILVFSTIEDLRRDEHTPKPTVEH